MRAIQFVPSPGTLDLFKIFKMAPGLVHMLLMWGLCVLSRAEDIFIKVKEEVSSTSGC